jgi:hypothetical protein
MKKTIKQKLFEIYKELKNVEKDTANEFTKNRYASEKAVLELVKPEMIKQGLMMFPEYRIVNNSPDGDLSSSYYECLFSINDCVDDNEPVVICWHVPLDKKTIQGFGGLTTYLTRYFYIKTFQLATDSVDDPDKEKDHEPVFDVEVEKKVSFRDKINKEKK